MSKVHQFKCLLKSTGMTSNQCSDYLGVVRYDTVKNWSSGRRLAPPDAIDKMRALVSKIDDLVANNITDIDEMNLPNINCCRVVLGRIIAKN